MPPLGTLWKTLDILVWTMGLESKTAPTQIQPLHRRINEKGELLINSKAPIVNSNSNSNNLEVALAIAIAIAIIEKLP